MKLLMVKIGLFYFFDLATLATLCDAKAHEDETTTDRERQKMILLCSFFALLNGFNSICAKKSFRSLYFYYFFKFCFFPLKLSLLFKHRILTNYLFFISTNRFTDLGKLYFLMVVKLKAQSNFHYCPSCLKNDSKFESCQIRL